MEKTWLEDEMQARLSKRAEKKSLRIYQQHTTQEPIEICSKEQQLDFSSNDYLGLAQDGTQKQLVASRYQQLQQEGEPELGATGSRLLSGDSTYARQLEQRLANWHNRPAALLFNSGYDANLSVLSCLPCDCFLFDEYSHNSLRMGMRLSQKFRNVKDEQHGSFLHNSVDDLQQKLKELKQREYCSKPGHNLQILIVVESVYSMDGDVAPLREILDLALDYGAMVLVDEAHGIGIFGDDRGDHCRGTGVLTQLQLELHPALAASIHTFGKAAGCHGAVVCGSETMRQYLWNYGWPLIYSTSLPLHSLVAIECSYETMTSPRGKQLRKHTQNLVALFRKLVEEKILCRLVQQHQVHLLPSTSPIQALVIPNNGNEACTEFCQRAWITSNQTIRLYPIKSPTVPEGKERIRIILHGHNTPAQVKKLVECMVTCLVQMGLLGSTTTGSMVASRL